jgi:hypothetical protein
MSERAHVAVGGAVNGRYVITDRRRTGELTLAPDTSADGSASAPDCSPIVSEEQFDRVREVQGGDSCAAKPSMHPKADADDEMTVGLLMALDAGSLDPGPCLEGVWP